MLTSCWQHLLLQAPGSGREREGIAFLVKQGEVVCQPKRMLAQPIAHMHTTRFVLPRFHWVLDWNLLEPGMSFVPRWGNRRSRGRAELSDVMGVQQQPKP